MLGHNLTLYLRSWGTRYMVAAAGHLVLEHTGVTNRLETRLCAARKPFRRRRTKMAAGYTLPPLAILEIHDPQASEKWKKFKRAWTNYALATELNKKPEAVQVATLLTVIGEDRGT